MKPGTCNVPAIDHPDWRCYMQKGHVGCHVEHHREGDKTRLRIWGTSEWVKRKTERNRG